jgi:hypothetical protein
MGPLLPFPAGIRHPQFRKKGWLWSLYLPMTVIISDLISSTLIKGHLVFRLRPCNNPLWADSMRFLANYCP